MINIFKNDACVFQCYINLIKIFDYFTKQLEKACEIAMKFRKSIREFCVKLERFQKAP